MPTERDLDANPYSPDEARIVRLLNDLGAGGGDDPINFILASHAHLAWERNTLRDQRRPAPGIVDPIVEAVRLDLLQRSQIGMAKYGTTLARTDLSLRDWLQHAYEERLDAANYLKRAILEIDAGATAAGAECPPE